MQPSYLFLLMCIHCFHELLNFYLKVHSVGLKNYLELNSCLINDYIPILSDHNLTDQLESSQIPTCLGKNSRIKIPLLGTNKMNYMDKY